MTGDSKNMQTIQKSSSELGIVNIERLGLYRVFLTVVGFVVLGVAIGSLQNLAHIFADDETNTIFIDNWIP